MITHTQSLPAAANPKHVGVILFVLAVGIGCLSLMVPGIERIIIAAGTNVVAYPGEDLYFDYVIGLIWAAALFISLFFWPVSKPDRRALLILWGARVLVALGLSLVYEYKYGLDIDGHFGHAIRSTFAWSDLRLWGDGTHNVRRLVWLHTNLIPDSYHAAKVGFSYVGLVAVYLFYRAANLFARIGDNRLLYAVGLFPSILFWSTILSKDPIALFGMALYCYGVVGMHRLGKFKFAVCILAGIVIMGLIRMWLVPICLIPYLMLQAVTSKKVVSRLFLGAATVAILIPVLWQLKDTWGIETVSDAVEFRAYASLAFEGGGSSLNMPEIGGGGALLLPLAIFMALFRPLPLEVSGAFGFLQGLDNLLLLAIFAVSVFRGRIREFFDPLILWATLVVLAWASVYGMVAYNLGTLARYKLQIIPLLIGLLLYHGRSRKGDAAKFECHPE